MARTGGRKKKSETKSPPARHGRRRNVKLPSRKQPGGSNKSQIVLHDDSISKSSKNNNGPKHGPPGQNVSGKKKKHSGRGHPHQRHQGNRNASEKVAADLQPLLQTKTVAAPRMLVWKCTVEHVPVKSERALLPHLILHKRRESGMMRDQPKARIKSIRKLCAEHGVPLLSALSLRRGILESRPGPKAGPSTNKEVAKSAQLFEDALSTFLNDRGVEFWSEDDQRKHNGRVQRPTPDVLLCQEWLCRRTIKGKVVQEGILHWIDAKMFYGASTVPQNNKSCVGRLVKTAEKYVKLFGPGAFCFQFGCGEELASKLAAMGVMALDCSACVNLKEVETHHKTWCGDEKGNILF